MSGSLGTRDDYPHLLRFLDYGEKFVNLGLADLCQEPEAKATPDHCGSRQRPSFILVEALQPAADDQANVIRNVDLFDLNVLAEWPASSKTFPSSIRCRYTSSTKNGYPWLSSKMRLTRLAGALRWLNPCNICAMSSLIDLPASADGPPSESALPES